MKLNPPVSGVQTFQPLRPQTSRPAALLFSGDFVILKPKGKTEPEETADTLDPPAAETENLAQVMQSITSDLPMLVTICEQMLDAAFRNADNEAERLKLLKTMRQNGLTGFRLYEFFNRVCNGDPTMAANMVKALDKKLITKLTLDDILDRGVDPDYWNLCMRLWGRNPLAF